MPAAPALNEQDLAPVAAGPRPRSVSTAFILWMVLAVILVASLILVLAASDDSLRDAAKQALDRQGKKTPSEQEINDTISLIRTFGIVFNLVFVALIVGFAFLMRGGKNWARISVTVVGGILVVLGLFGGGINVVFVLIELLIIVAAVYFMFRPDTKPFFGAGKAPR